VGARLRFREGDIRALRLDRRFQAVVALFHVVSYVTANADLQRLLRGVREHLVDGGLFVFDCWYGPCVLSERPAVRVLRMEDEALRVVRVAEPVLHPNANVVDVNYHILMRAQATGAVEEVRECHPMRYFFRPELDLLLEQAALKVVAAEQWMTGREPGCDTWGVCLVARA
jgi:hypothetical protein